MNEFAYAGDGVQDHLASHVQVQDHSCPQRVGRFDPVRSLGNDTCLVVDPFHDTAGLPGFEVVQDLFLPILVGTEERLQFGKRVRGIDVQLHQLLRCLLSIRRLVKYGLEAHPEIVQRPQLRYLREQFLQLGPLLVRQARRIAAHLPHPRTKFLPLRW